MLKTSSYLLLFTLLIINTLEAQQLQKPSSQEVQNLPIWAQMMYAENPNIFELRNAYENYYRTHTFEKNYHTQFYKRLMRQAQYNVNDLGFLSPIDEATHHTQQANYLKKQAKQTKASNWSVVGPITNYQEGATPGSGQTNVYAFDQCEGQPNFCYAGTEPGEVYRSIDAGNSWTLVSQALDFGSGVTAIEVHPTNGNMIFAAGNNGIFKSSDAGNNWTQVLVSTGLNANELFILPSNTNIVFAATDKGLYRSTDAGQNWNLLFNQKTYDIKLKPNTSQTLYLLKNNPALIRAEFYVSTDAGLSWTLQDNGWYSSTDPARIDGGGRLAVSSANPQKVYAYLIGASKPNDVGFIGVYVSENAGATWALPNGPTGGPYSASHLNLACGSPTWDYHQGFYNCAIVANPNNANEILVGGLNLFRSTDGGLTFSSVSGYVGGPLQLHVDNQDFRVIGNHTWITTDGGIYHSSNFMTTQPDFMMSGVHGSDYWGFDNGWNEDVLVGGLYHNGNLAYHENYGAGNFLELGGGEAPTGYINPGENRLSYFSDISGKRIPITLQGAIQNASFGISPNESYWAAESTELVFHPHCYGIAYTGKDNSLYMSKDKGASFELIQTFGSNPNEKINYIEISNQHPNVIYLNQKAASGAVGKLWKTTDAGQTWTQLNIPSGNSSRMLLALDASNEQQLWLAYPSGANGFKVFKTTDGGATWTNSTSSILNNESVQSLVHIAGTDGGIYVATNKAVYYRNNTQNFTLENNGLPTFTNGNILKPFYRDQKIRLATYGKGIYESNLAEIPSQVQARITVDRLSQTVTCEIDSFHFDDYSYLAHQGATWSWQFPTGIPAFSNLRNPSVYFPNAGQHLAILTITDANGNTDTDSLYVSLDFFAFQSGIEESFETNFLPSGWSVWDENGNGTWVLSSSIGAYANSSQSTYFDNYNINSDGSADDIIFPLQTAFLDYQPMLYFDVAYARWGAGYSDSLQVLVSTDCFETAQVVYYKGGTDLATSPDYQSFFTPSATQWRTDSVDLSAFAQIGLVQVAFRNIGHFGNCIYLDNIQIGSMAGQINLETQSRSIYPNPLCPGNSFQIQGPEFEQIILLDLNGKEVKRYLKNESLTIPSALKAGSYLLQVQSAKLISNLPIIVVQ
ncbi:MAG: VPS10 domain-containing protein [Flavobacteriales bacterium]